MIFFRILMLNLKRFVIPMILIILFLDNDVDTLDMCITVDEINLAVKKLKRCKAHVSDMLLNEYFIECLDILSSLFFESRVM